MFVRDDEYMREATVVYEATEVASGERVLLTPSEDGPMARALGGGLTCDASGRLTVARDRVRAKAREYFRGHSITVLPDEAVVWSIRAGKYEDLADPTHGIPAAVLSRSGMHLSLSTVLIGDDLLLGVENPTDKPMRISAMVHGFAGGKRVPGVKVAGEGKL